MLTAYEKKIILEEHFPTTGRTTIKIIKRLLSPFFTKYRIEGKMEGIIAFNSAHRDDYELFFRAVIGTYSKINRISISQSRCIRFDVIRLYIKYWLKSSKFEDIIKKETIDFNYKQTFVDKILTVSDLVSNNCMVRDLCNHIIPSIEGCLVYCDTLPKEAALVEACNHKGIITITCQHGINIPSNKIESIHQLNYKYVPSKIALVWGPKNKEIIEKHNTQCKCVVCGNPTIAITSDSQCENFIAIAGDIPENKKYNQELIKIAEKYAGNNNIRLVIRLHPVDKQDNYTINRAISSFGKEIDSATFILAHTTTMIFTYLTKGKKVYRLKSDVPYDLTDDSMAFRDDKELTELTEKNINYDKLIRGQVQFWGSESLNKYKEFFSTIFK